MKPIERAARAICAGGGELSSETQMRFAEQQARAVLQAIREPSPEMVSAAVQTAAQIGPHDHVGVFRAMIDAALSE
jgi:hypothetical protein